MARLQLDLSAASDDVITTLMTMCDLKTKKEVVENALMLLGWAAREASHGNAIAAVDEAHDSYKEIEIPALLGAKRTGAKSRARASTAAVA